MSRFKGALLGAVVTAAALPGAAQAATITVHDTASSPPHAFSFDAAPSELNNVRVTENADGSTVVTDSVPIQIRGEVSLQSCRLSVNAKTATCAPNAKPVDFVLGDGNDVIRYEASESMAFPFSISGLQGGAGNDTFITGLRRNAEGVLEIFGGPGTADKVTYASSPAAVNVSLDGLGNDGHAADRNNVGTDVEVVEGSTAGDTLTASDADHREILIGGNGNDRLTGLNGTDVFVEGAAPSGSDTIAGGGGIDLVDYSQRSNRVDVRMDDVTRNDGEAGELDFVDPNTNDVFGGSAGDMLVGGSGANVLIGNGGDDALVGNGGNDELAGGTGRDFLSGGANDDLVDSVDNAPDTIRCESGQDTLTRDLQDVDAIGCEVVNSVGKLTLAAKGGDVRLSWTHPRSWKQLRTVTLRLRGAGKVVIKPRAETIAASGKVKLTHAKLSHRGGKVTARLKLRVHPSLAGKRLRADVVAVDVRGTRQVERGAATIRLR